ncbi:hypothetical protein M0R45_018825 [Rubus argutus]|uniref:F-box protein n=1 Tax=Rubus argutus TaxID=59490 RepID=A0AAW1X426_RUBAR
MLYVHPSVELYMEHYRFYVCNPTTKQFKAIAFPFQFQYADSNRIYGVNLAFDPTHSPHFKVVCVLGKSSLDSYYLHVYDSKTDTWNPSPNLQYLLIHQKPHFFLPLCFADAPFTGTVMKRLRSTSMWIKSASTQCQCQCQRSLRMMSRQSDISGVSRPSASDNVSQASVLSVVRAEREEDSEVVLNVFDMVVSYNFKDGTFKFIRYLVLCREVAARGLRYTWRNAFPFIETLCPVDRACN